MDIRVLDDNPLYKDQIYRLKFTFSNKYPIGKTLLHHLFPTSPRRLFRLTCGCRRAS